MGKVRRVDWSPDEYLGGTFGKLTAAEHGVYIIVLSLIYSNGGPVENDLQHFTRACAGTHWRTVKAALDGLMAKGKLNPSPDGKWLTNGRAVRELDHAQHRMETANRNGSQGGRPPSRRVQDQFKTGSRPVQETSKSAKTNGLAKPGGLYHHHHHHIDTLSESLTGAAREGELAGPARPARDGIRSETRRMPTGPGVDAPVDPAQVEALIRELGVDPANVEAPPPPVSRRAVPETPPTTAKLLAEKAGAARRKLMGGT